MKDILWIKDIVECTKTTPFFDIFIVDMADFVYSHKVVAWRNKFSTIENAQNEGVS
jgi:hypothetical protein